VEQNKGVFMKIFLLVLSFGILNASWHPLKLIKAYGGRDFTLKSGVEYVEIIHIKEFNYYTEKGSTKSKSSKSVIKIYRKPLNSYGFKVEKNFKRLPLSSKKSNSFLHDSTTNLIGSSSWCYNGFMLDSNLKTWRLENTKDLIDMLKPINTPADVKLVMWANKYAEGFLTNSSNYHAKYKKVGKNFIVQEHYNVENSAYGDCGIYTYKSTVTRDGKVLNRRLIKKAPPKFCISE